MQIILTTKPQLKIIQDLAYKIWPDAYAEILSEAQLDYMLENFYSIASLENQFENGHIFLLAEENGQYLGFASYEINCKAIGKTKLHKIYVMPNTQGKGVGKFLLEEVEDRAKQAGNSILFLNVNKYNKAQKFYENKGFLITQEEVIPIGNDYIMDDYVMEKSL
ncbi:MAG: GNAT family N-acetyltransferase [Limnohabitans sp.]|nr:GNAT family N-acetyltransferase [Limnohabitans sp.]